ncbi:hypothetical protein AVEN_69116-2 [Araneus ventricosus]|uniref:Uncharacterized protein n=1 Tax=Araneus ventricosus TaxID=182803 RepID=A0A4Y2HZX2_ARAVE|nr:hypothetical protein AVEN_69116-2 [Araneus ventricosus]
MRKDSVAIKQSAMEVFFIMLIVFVSNANSKLAVDGGGVVAINAAVSTTMCNVGGIIASTNSQVAKRHAQLSWHKIFSESIELLIRSNIKDRETIQIGYLSCPFAKKKCYFHRFTLKLGLVKQFVKGFQKKVKSSKYLYDQFPGLSASTNSQVETTCSTLPGINNPAVSAANVACNAAIGTLGTLSTMFTKSCPNGLQQTTPAPTTISTSTQAPTTVTTQTPGSTTPGPCTESEQESCDRSCQRQFDVDINFGGNCRRHGKKSYACGCKRVEHCETYKNATCKKECKNGRICRIPEKNFPCVCKIGSGNFFQYRLPNSSYV